MRYYEKQKIPSSQYIDHSLCIDHPICLSCLHLGHLLCAWIILSVHRPPYLYMDHPLCPMTILPMHGPFYLCTSSLNMSYSPCLCIILSAHKPSSPYMDHPSMHGPSYLYTDHLPCTSIPIHDVQIGKKCIIMLVLLYLRFFITLHLKLMYKVYNSR